MCNTFFSRTAFAVATETAVTGLSECLDYSKVINQSGIDFLSKDIVKIRSGRMNVFALKFKWCINMKQKRTMPGKIMHINHMIYDNKQ